MENMLEKIIDKNEKKYNAFKSELEKILAAANSEYSSLLNDYRTQIQYIKNDSMYSKEGKIRKAKEIHDSFISKVKNKSDNYFEKLIAITDDELTKRKKEKTDEYISPNDDNYYSKKILNTLTKQHLNSNHLVQLIYVNSMLNSINDIDDADMLESVFNYTCVDANFSDELINMVYMKAKRIANTPGKKIDNSKKIDHNGEVIKSNNNNKDVDETVKRSLKRSKMYTIIDKIDKYNHDYSVDIAELKSQFNRNKDIGSYYPYSLYLSKKYEPDFAIPRDLSNYPWN